jgi:uncharacterized phage protein gp47/JayE
MADIILSTVSPDHSDIVSQLQAALLTRDSWQDRITSSTGQTLIEFQAAIGAYDQYAIESAFQEVFPESAKNATSIYAAAEFLGVRTNRKIGATVTVSLTSPVNVTIPVYSQFLGGGTFWYNKTALNVTSTPTVFTLTQGKVVQLSTTGLGTDFQSFVSQEADFVVHDQDVLVKINSVNQYVSTDGLWTRPSLDGVQNKTLPDGRMLLLFGNTIYGSKPVATDVIDITYIVTQGSDSNNLPISGRPIALETDPTVAGTFTALPSGGGSQSPFLVYKNITPALFGSFNSSVTAAQYKRLPLQYPGVIDAQTFAQREVNPKALAWMNVIKVCLLTTSPFGGPQFAAFEDFFLRNTMYSTRIYRQDPIPVNVDVDVDVFCANFSNLSEIKQKVEAALDALFAPRQGIIGLDIYLSDIYDAIEKADANIRYILRRTPTTDIVISSLNVEAPSATVVNLSGTLAPGFYDYAVSVVSSLGGETAPLNWTTVEVVTPGARVDLAWPAVSNAANYKIWGRTTPSPLGLIGTVGPSTLVFTDSGATVPTGTVPAQSTVAIYYPRLNSKNVVTKYSTRTNEIS